MTIKNKNNNHNEKIINEFEKLINQIKFEIDNAPSKSEAVTNSFRLKQIKQALDIIKKYPKIIKNGSELKDIKGIGKGTMTRIDEILTTGKLSEIKIKKEHKKYLNYIEELETVIGIGRKTAYDLVTKHGIKSVGELKNAYNNNEIELNDQILIGLKYHNIYKQTIPRSEIDNIFKYLQKNAHNVDNKLNVTICGSYRRLKPTSNDVDVLITHPDIKTKIQLASSDNYLKKFVKKLKDENFLLDDITDKDFEIKYMGFCQYKNNPVRRIDIRYVPFDSYYASLIYFTGSSTFNQKMRELAKQLGFLLNEYGLYRIVGTKKVIIKVNSEKDIFDKLGMEYLPPENRN